MARIPHRVLGNIKTEPRLPHGVPRMALGTWPCLMRAAASHPLPRLEKEIEVLDNADALPATARENRAAPRLAHTPALSPAKETQKAEVVQNSQQVRRFPGPWGATSCLLWPDFRASCVGISACRFPVM